MCDCFVCRECVCIHLDNDSDKFEILVYVECFGSCISSGSSYRVGEK